MTDLTAYLYGPSNPRISSDDWNGALGAIQTGINATTSSVVTPQQYGAVADGVTDDSAAFVAALAYLKSIASNDTTIYKGSPRLFVPAGNYYMGTTTLEITHTLVIEGEGTGQAGGNASKLRWAANTTGIRIQRYDTSGSGTVDGITHYGGDAATIRGLYLEGAYTNFASEGEHHAIHAKARWKGVDLFIRLWQGDGIYMYADAGLPGATHGNANQWQMQNVTTWYCRNGFRIGGYDANAGVAIGCDTSYNRRWGRYMDAVLVNTFIGHHSDSNGLGNAFDATYPAAICSYGGNVYQTIPGQETWCSTNAPSGTTANNTGWIYLFAGGAVGGRPTWVSGMTWVDGGVIYNPQGNNVCIGDYIEGGQPYGQVAATLLIGSNSSIATPIVGIGGNTPVGCRLDATSGGMTAARDFTVSGSFAALGSTNYFGRDSILVQDNNTYFRNTNSGAFLFFNTFDTAGTLTSDDGYLYWGAGGGVSWNPKANTAFKRNNTTIATLTSSGFDIASGKALLVNGTQVVGAQGAAVADATDAASTMARLNDLLARLRTHGVIAT